MLVVLMYHRVIQTSFKADPESFVKHVTYLANNFHIVTPGDALIKNKVNVCLTFDDAYFDFYHCVFPLLKQLNIKALLAIPAGLILDQTDLDAKVRLGVPYQQARGAYQTHATLCTWQEINEMIASKLVIPASHGLTHQRAKPTAVYLEEEIIYSKHLIEQKTKQKIKTFVYPYGTMTRLINKTVNNHYEYAMRIGSAANTNWTNRHKVIYRINADKIWPENKPFLTHLQRFILWARYISNTIRFK